MNYLKKPLASGLRRKLAVGACIWACSTAQAAPGAHGPGGEHLDGPVAAIAVGASPRLQANTEAFELVAELRRDELSIYVDRYETNAPVLDARLEVESGTLTALAAFRPAQGDYVVTDAGLLKLLAQPGQHPLVFTITAGAESDLLNGSLIVSAAGGDQQHVHSHALERVSVGAALALGLGLGGVLLLRQRRLRHAGARAERGAQ